MGLAIIGLLKSDRKRYKQAAIVFFSTWILMLLITVIEFALR